VVLEHDVSDGDRCDRLLRCVYLSDGTWANGVLAEEGDTRMTIYELDDRYEDALYGLEQKAQDSMIGGWVECEW